MDVTALTRELGKAIQSDERYLGFMRAKKANDADMELNALIGKLNLIQMNYQNESSKDAPDEKKLEGMDAEFRDVYGSIMLNSNMQNYEEAKQQVDDMMNYLIGILTLCVNGEDPETCEPQDEQSSCAGDCSSCGGCH